MEVQKTTLRINKIVYERVKLFAIQNRTTINNMINEILELGILKKIEGETNEKK